MTRCGYTGEDGVELSCPAEQTQALAEVTNNKLGGGDKQNDLTFISPDFLLYLCSVILIMHLSGDSWKRGESMFGRPRCPRLAQTGGDITILLHLFSNFFLANQCNDP